MYVIMPYDFSDIVIEEILGIVKKDFCTGDSKANTRNSEGIIVALNGVLRYEHNGKIFTSDEHHVLVVPKGITYSFVSQTKSTSIVINFRSKNPLATDTILSIEQDSSLFASRMEKLWTFHKASYKLKCMSLLYSFFAEHNQAQHYMPSSKYDLLRPGIHYLEEHYTDPQLRDVDMAEAAGISTVYFRKLFVQKFGVPPMKYVRQKRIERAKTLLSSDFYTTISDVATDSGFSSLYHFSKVFKQETSLTPSEFAIIERSNIPAK